LQFITRKHFYEQMKTRQDVPINEIARLGIDILASLSTYHIDPVGARDFFSPKCPHLLWDLPSLLFSRCDGLSQEVN
jgi:hypothetical protein